MVDGWEAPALTAPSRAPVPWTADALYRYLRHGHSAAARHRRRPDGRRWCSELAALPDADIRAMAHLPGVVQPARRCRRAGRRRRPRIAARSAAGAHARRRAAHVRQRLRRLPPRRRRPDACSASTRRWRSTATCTARGPTTCCAPSSTACASRPTRDIGFMPAFRDALDDAQIAELAGYMRQRFAPDKPPWRDLPARWRGCARRREQGAPSA